MRIGIHPEKEKLTKIHYKKHRVIIPVYIPESKETYFENLFEVFKRSMDSLLQTIPLDTTAITIINNACKQEVTEFIDGLLVKNKIDKHVKLTSNYGKVYTIISEARATYEEYITIADADVFYFNNWEKEVFSIFSNFNNVGVVSPVPAPHLARYHNVSFFGSLFKKYKKGKVVDSKSFDFFEIGTNNPDIFKNHNSSWKEYQYYIEKKGVKACVGCGHFVATYKNFFKSIEEKKPEFVFKDGDEDMHLDAQFDKLGLYRVSTIKTFAYHLGNTIPTWVKEYRFNQNNTQLYNRIQFKKIKSKKLIYLIKKQIFRVLKKCKII